MDIAYAATTASTDYANAIVEKVKMVIIYPLITFLFITAMLVFLFGIFQYVAKSTDEEARSAGRRHMIFGIVGFVVMLSAVAILNIARGTFGI